PMPRLYQSPPSRLWRFDAWTKPKPNPLGEGGSPERTACTTRSGSADSASEASDSVSASGAVGTVSSVGVASWKVSGAETGAALATVRTGAALAVWLSGHVERVAALGEADDACVRVALAIATGAADGQRTGAGSTSVTPTVAASRPAAAQPVPR